MQGQQAVVDVLGQAVHRFCRIHDPPRQIRLAHRLAGVFADLGGEDGADFQLRTQAQQHRVDAHGVGVGQFGQVAHAHHDLHAGIAAAGFVVACQRVGKAEMDGVEDGIDDEFAAFRPHPGDGPVQRVQIAMFGGNQDRRGGHRVGDPQRVFVQAQQEIRPGLAAAQQIPVFQGIHADLEAFRLQRGDGLLHVVKRRGRQTAQVDHVRAVAPVVAGLAQDRVHRHARSLGDFGEDAQVIAVQRRLFGLFAEELRQVAQFFRAALDAYAQIRRQLLQITPAAPRHQHPVRAEKIFQPPPDHVRRHQRRHRQAQLVDGVAEFRGHVGEDLPQLLLCQLAGQKQDVFGHGRGLRGEGCGTGGL